MSEFHTPGHATPDCSLVQAIARQINTLRTARTAILKLGTATMGNDLKAVAVMKSEHAYLADNETPAFHQLRFTFSLQAALLGSIIDSNETIRTDATKIATTLSGIERHHWQLIEEHTNLHNSIGYCPSEPPAR